MRRAFHKAVSKEAARGRARRTRNAMENSIDFCLKRLARQRLWPKTYY